VLQAAAFGAAGGLIFGPLGGKVAGAAASRIASSAAGRVASSAAGRIASSAVGRGASAVARSISRGMSRLGSSKLGTLMGKGATGLRKGVRAIEEVGAGAGTSVRYQARRAADAIRTRVGRPRASTGPVDDAFRAKPIRALRQDNNFKNTHNDYDGKPKSHITQEGDLHPNNPGGDITPLDHITARVGKKEVSQYTSIMTRESGLKPRYYGSREITLDMERLAVDVSRGRVPGTQILTPQQLQQGFRDDAARLLPPDFNIEGAIAGGKEGIRDAIAATPGLSNRVRKQAEKNLLALFYNSRDGEWLIAGVIPSKYIIHEGHTLPGAAGAAAGSSSANDEK